MGSPVRADSPRIKLYRALCISFLLLFIGGALSIPFVYESQTLWYKVGIDKTMLRGGQMAGLLTAVLLFVQILLATRGTILKKLFGETVLIRWHRVNGIIIFFTAFSHVILVLAPEGLMNLPIGIKFWPEMVGSLLLWIIFSMVISSQFREKMGLDYRRWKVIHQFLGYLVIMLLSVHVFFVTDSFRYAVPGAALATTLFVVVVSVVLSKK